MNLHRGLVVGQLVKLRRKRRRWNGGYIHAQKDGRDLFIIERQVGETRYHLSTGAHSWKAALEQLERFEAAPHLYEKGGGVGAEAPLYVTEQLVIDFLKHQSAVKRVSALHAYDTGRYLEHWLADLAGVNLRHVGIEVLHRALDARRSCRPKRIAALKVFCGWLREKRGALNPATDTTMNLRVPQSEPEQYRHQKAVPVAHVRRVLAKLRPEARDCLRVLASTGMHLSELVHFAREGELVKRPRGAVTLVTKHKSGEPHLLDLVGPTAAAAGRIHRRGYVPSKLSGEMKTACLKARVPEFGTGVIRHSVATWAAERGVPLAEIAVSLGHKDPRTTRRFYLSHHAAPPRLKLPRL